MKFSTSGKSRHYVKVSGTRDFQRLYPYWNCKTFRDLIRRLGSNQVIKWNKMRWKNLYNVPRHPHGQRQSFESIWFLICEPYYCYKLENETEERENWLQFLYNVNQKFKVEEFVRFLKASLRVLVLNHQTRSLSIKVPFS